MSTRDFVLDDLSQYLSPEPLLQNPRWVRHEAKRGFSVPTYAYARNNPIKYTDPTGLCPWCAATAWTIEVGFGVSVGDAAMAAGAAAAGAITGAMTWVPPMDWGGREPGAGVPFPPTAPSPPLPHPPGEPGVPTIPNVGPLICAMGAVAMAKALECTETSILGQINACFLLTGTARKECFAVVCDFAETCFGGTLPYNINKHCSDR